MNLNDDFCKEIFKREKEWINLANKNLLNVYYINGRNGLREFYESKKIELQENYSATSKLVKTMTDMINNILLKIDFVTNEHKDGKRIDMKCITDLFLLYQLNDNKEDNRYNLVELQAKALEKLEGNFILPREEYDDDYLYDDELYD